MIEIAGDRQQFGDRIASPGGDKHRDRVDTHLRQQGVQQDRLGLAVSVALLPRLFRRLRHVIAAIETVEEVAHLVLNQPHCQGRALKRIAGSRHDFASLGGDVAVISHLGRYLVVRSEGARQILPVGEGPDPQNRIAIEARRGIARHIGKLVYRQRDSERLIAVDHYRRLYTGYIFGPPVYFTIFRPADDGPGEADLPRLLEKVLRRLHFIAERLVIYRDRVRHPQDVVDLQARYGKRCGKLSVEQTLLKATFAADNLELCPAADDIDALACADDLDPMHSQVALVGQPGKRNSPVVHE